MGNIYPRCIACLLLGTIIGQSIYAQSQDSILKKHQVSFGAPLLTLQELTTGIQTIVTGIGDQKVEDVKGRATYSLSYRYFPSRRWGIGVTGIYQKLDVKFVRPTAKRSYVTMAVMANGQYNYIAKPKFDVYSRLAAGVVQFDETGPNAGPSYTTLAFQVTAIGARMGGTFSTFIECGFGYEGLIHAGFCLRI